MEKGEGCEIEARELTYKIITSTKTNTLTQEKYLLNNITCRAKPWELLAVVGPSGAGKSTLLQLLAGRLTSHSPSLFVNQAPLIPSLHKKLTGFVTQHDTLFPLLSVKETLMFSARLRLGLPTASLTSRINSLLSELGLTHVANSRTGDGMRIRGISGGERRRVSIGVEVVHDPATLVLDEPTSGLDSSSALQVVTMLKAMSDTRGRTIILSIHQPSFRIIKLFNSLLILVDGSVAYNGTVDQLQSTLTAIGLRPPPHSNIVEFAIESINTLQQNVINNTDRPSTLQQLFQLDLNQKNVGAAEYANCWLGETAILTQRFLINVSRTKELFACRTVQMLASGLMLGSIFYELKHDRVGAAERVGLFAFILTYLLSCTTEALPVFLREREIFMKETSCGSYRVSSYVLANGLVFLPFLFVLAVLFSLPVYFLVGLNRSLGGFMYFLLLIWLVLYTANSVVVCFGALVPNFIVGNSVISGVMGSFFLFSGYFISKEGMPGYWVFMHYVSLFKYPFEGFLVNEFEGFGCLEEMMGVCLMDGEGVLREEGLGGESRWRNVGVMVGFILGYRFLSYVILRCRCWCVENGGAFKRGLVSRCCFDYLAHIVSL